MSKPYYITEGIFTEDQIRDEKSPLKAIKNYCRYHCCVDDKQSWKECEVTDCFLYKFRLGKSGRVLSEKQKENLKKNGERLASYTNSRK